MNQHTLECYASDQGWTVLTFSGFMPIQWVKTALGRYTFKRHGHMFEVLSFNAIMPQELASVAVDNFFKPHTRRESVDLTRLEIVRGGGLKK